MTALLDGVPVWQVASDQNLSSSSLFALWVSVGLGFTTTLVSRVGSAQSMAPALHRLVVDSSCQSAAAVSEGRLCRTDEVAFKRLVNQWAFAAAPSPLYPARTTGLSGFSFGIEAQFAKISGEAEYWKQGTRGLSESRSTEPSSFNADPDGFLQLYSAKFRKGLGLGFELGGSLGIMPKTSFWAVGFDARVALLEGFRTGQWRYLPDVSIGAGVRKLTGNTQLSLMAEALDAHFSKTLVIPGWVVITPWLGYQYLWFSAGSAQVDLTPSVSGDPVVDAANNVIFETVHLQRQRVTGGAQYRYEYWTAGLGIAVDLIAPASAQPHDTERTALRGQPHQWSLILEVGTAF